MTQDEIIEMAKEIANTFGTPMCDENGETHGEELYAMCIDDIVDTIKLVAEKAFQNGYEKGIAAFNDAVLLEREACAKLCDELHYEVDVYGAQCAAAIRARGQA